MCKRVVWFWREINKHTPGPAVTLTPTYKPHDLFFQGHFTWTTLQNLPSNVSMLFSARLTVIFCWTVVRRNLWTYGPIGAHHDNLKSKTDGKVPSSGLKGPELPINPNILSSVTRCNHLIENGNRISAATALGTQSPWEASLNAKSSCPEA